LAKLIVAPICPRCAVAERSRMACRRRQCASPRARRGKPQVGEILHWCRSRAALPNDQFL